VTFILLFFFIFATALDQSEYAGQLAANKQETQLLLTNHTMHLCKRNGVPDLLKNMALPICATIAEFGCSA